MCSSLVLAGYGCYHFKILLRFKEQNDKFAASNRKMKKHNVELEIEVRKLERAERELAEVQNSLKATTRMYEENIEKFRGLDERLHKLGDSSIEGMERLKQMSHTLQDTIKKEMVQHERNILARVQEALEYGDDKDGLSEDEYNRFVNALPKNFRNRFASMDKTFADFAGDDGIMDFDEFTELADTFAQENVERKCKKINDVTPKQPIQTS